MASTSEQNDALSNLRQCIASGQASILTTSADPSVATDTTTDFAKATHIHFSGPQPHVFAFTSATRFIAPGDGKPVDLRSIYFAWLHRDDTTAAYVSARAAANRELASPGAAEGEIRNLPFTDRTDLVAWLDGTNEESENIQPLDAQKAHAQAERAAAITAGQDGAVPGVGMPASAVNVPRVVDPKLVKIYAGERKMGDRNSILRGIKPTDFSHVRKQADQYLGRGSRSGASSRTIPSAATSTNPALVSNLKKPTSTRRQEPIILLSPSASSLLRMSNIKQFLESGFYMPADSASVSANILNTSRLMPSIDPQRPFRFILVDTPDQFKPDYWQRVVAVFTTGQTWQFKSYKWQNPPDLFAHALGIYVGWTGEGVPDTVKGWGRAVKVAGVDKWTPYQGEKGRWRDREVVEAIWTGIEESMRKHGWTKDGFMGG